MRVTKVQLQEELKKTTEAFHYQVDKLNEELRKVTKERNTLKEDNFKISVRLDACLYSMVLMQNVIKSTKLSDYVTLAT